MSKSYSSQHGCIAAIYVVPTQLVVTNLIWKHPRRITVLFASWGKNLLDFGGVTLLAFWDVGSIDIVLGETSFDSSLLVPFAEGAVLTTVEKALRDRQRLLFDVEPPRKPWAAATPVGTSGMSTNAPQ